MSQPPELDDLEALLERLKGTARIRTLAYSDGAGGLPVYGLTLGSEDRSKPTLCIVGGVHGLERIGTRVVLAYLHTLTELLQWDATLRSALERSRIVLLPIVNPGGLAARTRSNPRGVDLMRNAPVESVARASFLVGGQRLSSRLPWFRGSAGQMEAESQALCDFVRRECFEASAVISLDCHSGFGLVDRLWFPYARSRRPFPDLASTFALRQLLDYTLPNHVYRVEPQSQNYTVQGDLWDYLYDAFRDQRPDAVFLPLTLEMGSWLWVRKNPRQALSALGGFNPIKPHRLRRTLRRHLPLLDFLHRAIASHERWLPKDDSQRDALRRAAFRTWYADAL
ncbi:MAG: M14 family zinc carboxypeptidase [Myxococcota bacterium]